VSGFTISETFDEDCGRISEAWRSKDQWRRNVALKQVTMALQMVPPEEYERVIELLRVRLAEDLLDAAMNTGMYYRHIDTTPYAGVWYH